ncbi:condensation domain-containing protein [Vibrio sp. PP-XX7]
MWLHVTLSTPIVFQETDASPDTAVTGPSKTDTRLVAYYTLQAGTTTTIDALRSQLGAHLPEYMVPSAYVALDTIPLTPNGKVDRQVLPQPDESAFTHQTYEAPQEGLEQQLADIWQTLLGVSQVGRQDNSFELGGHSLLAVQLASRIRTVFGREMGLPTLFTYPCLHRLAAWIEKSAAIQATLPDIIPLAEGELAPLAYAQQPIWFLSQVDPTSVAAYVIPWRVRLTGTLNIAALQQALDTIVARHEPLRSCVGYDDGKPVQQVHAPTCGFTLSQIDVRQADHTGPDKSIPLFVPTFDLTTGPMIQGQLVRLSDDEFLLQIAMHHFDD